MSSCRDFCRAIATGELERAGMWRRLRLRLHLLLCDNCRRYAEQIATLDREASELLGQPAGEEADLKRLRATTLERWKAGSTK